MTFVFAILVARPGGIFCFLEVKAATALHRRQQENETSFHLAGAAIQPIQASEKDGKIDKRFNHVALAIERSSGGFRHRVRQHLDQSTTASYQALVDRPLIKRRPRKSTRNTQRTALKP
ncbi:hypothetical protein [Salinisphaera shabanensis]|uniref:hypothetical protein n=1 Tax=Salinisphaera shabanensis TaxID=180542 RepID=UPI0002123DD1|nr:hypothetical protein [Salinisphaera shabanensis]